LLFNNEPKLARPTTGGRDRHGDAGISFGQKNQESKKSGKEFSDTIMLAQYCRRVSKASSRESFLHKRFETGITAQWIEDRVYFDLEREPIALLRCLCQPGERLFVVPQSHISHKVMPRRNGVATRGFLLQSL
jgi:hypothetical protein